MQLQANYRSLLSIALPLALFQLVQNIIGFTDTVFLGRVGVVEFNACGIASMFYLVLMMVGYGLSRGAQILIARRAGEGDYRTLGLVADHLLVIEGLMAVGLFVITRFASRWLLPLFIQSDEILAAAFQYLDYRAYGIFFSLWGFVLLAIYSGVGRTKIITYVTFVLASVNIFLNYGLIFGAFGLPQMGIAGAGLASTIAELVSGLVGLAYLLRDPMRQQLNLFQFKDIQWRLVRRLWRVSMPLVVQFLVGLGGWFVFFTFIENLGATALAVSIVLKWIYQFFAIPSWSIASAVNSVASNLVGQRNFVATLTSIRRATQLSIATTLVPVALLYVFAQPIASIFTDNLDIVAGTVDMIPLIIGIITTCSVGAVAFNGLIGVGATRVSMICEVVGVALYLIYAYSIINYFNAGLGLVWCAELIYWTVLFFFSVIYLLRGRWQSNVI